MAVSNKIRSKIEKIDKKEKFKNLMLEILDEESKGLHNFKSKYIELIDKYIAEKSLGDVDNDKN